MFRLTEERVSSNPNILSIPKYQDLLPELPALTRKNLNDKFNLTLELAVRLVNEPDLLDLFLKTMKISPNHPTIVANMILLNVQHFCYKHFKDAKNVLKPEFISRAAEAKVNMEFTNSIIIKALEIVVMSSADKAGDLDFDEIIKANGWDQMFRNPTVISQIVQDTIQEQPKLVKKYQKTTKNQKVILSELLKAAMTKNDIIDPLMVKSELEKSLKV